MLHAASPCSPDGPSHAQKRRPQSRKGISICASSGIFDAFLLPRSTLRATSAALAVMKARIDSRDAIAAACCSVAAASASCVG